jgi:hypothetical protein
MTIPATTDYADLFFKHFATLRMYAEQVFIDGEDLTEGEEADKAARMIEFISVGARCDFNERQLITLLYAELF